jgi:predicted kinase
MLYFTIGPSHSGKSTYAKKWMLEQGERPRVVVTADSIRLALTNHRYNRYVEPIVFAHKHVMIKSLLIEGYDVLACGTHTTEESIKRILEIHGNAKYILFDVPLETCLSRIKLTGQTDMGPVITRHYHQMKTLQFRGIDNVIAKLNADINARWDKGKIV